MLPGHIDMTYLAALLKFALLCDTRDAGESQLKRQGRTAFNKTDSLNSTQRSLYHWADSLDRPTKKSLFTNEEEVC